jgi:hypothetical protein
MRMQRIARRLHELRIALQEFELRAQSGAVSSLARDLARV